MLPASAAQPVEKILLLFAADLVLVLLLHVLYRHVARALDKHAHPCRKFDRDFVQREQALLAVQALDRGAVVGSLLESVQQHAGSPSTVPWIFSRDAVQNIAEEHHLCIRHGDRKKAHN